MGRQSFDLVACLGDIIGGRVLLLSDSDAYQAGIDALGRGSDSPKAWMTARDADTLEAVFRAVARRVAPAPPRILEWGCGLSTLHYTRSLYEVDDRFLWVTVEHDRRFFVERVAPYLNLWSRAKLLLVDNNDKLDVELSRDPPRNGVLALVYDGGKLTPFKPGCIGDRAADLDAFVAGPSRLNMTFDAIFVDGRKRRRCLLEASRLVAEDGIVLLHDAQRPYYQCAWSAYHQGQRIGDELWVGAQQPTDFSDLVPEEALKGPGFAYDPYEFA